MCTACEMDSVTCKEWYGFPRFFGSGGPKGAMQRHAATLPGPVVQLQVTTGYGPKTAKGYERYGRSFVVVPDAPKNIGKLVNLLRVQIPRRHNHVNEIIVKGTCCKIMMTFDREEGFPAAHFADREDFFRKVEDALTKIMSKDFGIKLAPSSFVWLFTEYTFKQKFSAHLVIHHEMPDGSLLVVPSHKHTARHAGSRHFLDRLIQELPGVDSVKDYNIYSDDREMRLPLACKPNEKQLPNWTPGTLQFADPDTPYTHAMVTYFDGKLLHVLQMPTIQPAHIVKQSFKAAGRATKPPSQPPSHLTYSDAEQRMMELLRPQHPTVYRCFKGDIFNRDNAPRFNHTDRSEPCWCGKAHTSNNYSAWYSGNHAWVFCWAIQRAFRVGFLEDDFADVADVEVHLQYLDSRLKGDDNSARLNKAVCRLLGGNGAVLCIQSPMATGKTTMLKDIIEELEQQLDRPARVCIITYRTTLALNMEAALEGMGFINYLDSKRTNKLQTADKCIVQLDSIGMVLQRQIIPQYDLLVLDESESTLHHTTARTHGERQQTTFNTFCSIVKHAHRVLVADALLGKETRAFLKAVGKEPQVVRNTWRSDNPRTFVFTTQQDVWLTALVEQLRAGHNCAVASMSANKLHALRDFLVGKKILEESRILVYDSQTDDEVKRRVRYVNEDWVNYSLVMWSPAVEAGVNFDVAHFHSMFVIICNKSTVAMGAMQSTGRIRSLVNPRVLCWCQPGVAWEPEEREMRPEEAVDHLRWQQGLIQKQKLDNFEANIMAVGEEVLMTGEVALLPAADSPGMVVASHNYARIINSRHNLLPVFIRLLEQQGHRWAREAWSSCNKKAKTVTKEHLSTRNKASVLLAADVMDGQHLQELLMLQSSCLLRTNEKQMLARQFFCHRHHISNAALDENFLKHHPAEDEDASCLDVLIATLGHRTWLHENIPLLIDDGREMGTPVRARAELLAEVLLALRVDNVLECSSICLTARNLEALKKCKAFTHGNEAARVFEISTKGSVEFESSASGKFAPRLKAMFERAGLKCKSEAKRQRGGTTCREYTLSFAADQQQAMAKLVKLATEGDVDNVWKRRTVAEYLQQLALDDYAKYRVVSAGSTRGLLLQEDNDDF